jgi:hypothetical protein
MTALELMVAAAGCGVTALVVVGMILITPRGVVDRRAKANDAQSRKADQAATAERAGRVPARP